MEKVKVKAVEGRVAFTAPRGGVRIPTDDYVLTNRTAWIDRLHDHHGDIIFEADEAPVIQDKPAKKAATDKPAQTETAKTDS
jgi:hypothetical protein